MKQQEIEKRYLIEKKLIDLELDVQDSLSKKKCSNKPSHLPYKRKIYFKNKLKKRAVPWNFRYFYTPPGKIYPKYVSTGYCPKQLKLRKKRIVWDGVMILNRINYSIADFETNECSKNVEFISSKKTKMFKKCY